ncbi:hypothetical protein [Candidatus Laterigemmans baculatus]|uniref:hypothetical protein n=1 Tax=Candidatus Laterigemmans baculatus TaxID=2770505 RepID=UPI0013DBA191|nr:hypothetical protein [Candidatus Laterigemmans baculatus]
MKKLRSLLLVATLAAASGGCTMFSPAGFGSNDESAEPLQLQASQATREFSAIAEAQQKNSIVLQVRGAEPPTRILPLPADGKPVYVSDLLRQSGLSKQFSQMQAVLYRNSPDAIGGVRMGIRFRPGTNVLLPEHDYCLRPGDRLQVAEVESSMFGGIFDDIIPANGRRAAMGF